MNPYSHAHIPLKRDALQADVASATLGVKCYALTRNILDVKKEYPANSDGQCYARRKIFRRYKNLEKDISGSLGAPPN